jgi:hypothetical protein
MVFVPSLTTHYGEPFIIWLGILNVIQHCIVYFVGTLKVILGGWWIRLLANYFLSTVTVGEFMGNL